MTSVVLILGIERTMTELTKVPVEDADIDEMFSYADKNCDGKLSYSEFEVTIAKTWNSQF